MKKNKTHMVVGALVGAPEIILNTLYNRALYDTIYFEGTKAECEEWVRNYGGNV